MSEFNARVAEKVMGIKPRMVRPRGCGTDHAVKVYTDNKAICDGQWNAHELGVYGCPPPYDTDANADYSVLKHVRETWSGSELFLLGCKLDEVWAKRNPIGHSYVPENATYYQVGDYARAALALKESADAK